MRALAAALGLSTACIGAAYAQDGLIIDLERADRQAPGVDVETRQETRLAAEVATPAMAFAPFTLRGVHVSGSSIARAELDAATAPLVGQTFDGANLRQIADAIARLYARSDVALYSITIPEQDFAAGEVRVRVREGHIGAVSITGETSGDIDLLRHYAAALTVERPLTRPTMERQFSLISDIPGLETRVGMGAADATGGVRLGLDIDRRPWEYEIGLNNNGSDSLGETQLAATVIRNGLFRLGDQTRLTLASDAEFERFTLARLAHRQPVGHSGMSITGAISTLRTEPEGGVSGRADTAGLTLSYPWLRSYQRNLTLSFGIDGLDSDNAELGDVSAVERVRSVRAAAAYVQADARRAWVIGGTLSQGLDDFGARSADPGTVLDFTKVNLQLAHNHALGRRFIVRLAASGQWSGEALPASERFTLGGASFGRAFPSAFASGDDGFGASAELAWRPGIEWLPETYVFADGGRAWSVERPLTPSYTRGLASAGLGVRLALGEDARLDLEAAHAIDAPIPGDEPEEWRLRFGLSARL